MSNTVFCQRLKKELPGLNRVPFPGEIGKKVLENISQQAWQEWLAQQTILINEYRLNPMDFQARTFLEEEMIKFLFENGESQPVPSEQQGEE